MKLTAVIPPRGRLVLAAWAALPCAALAPFCFWQSIGGGLAFTLAAAALVFGVWCRACSFVAAADGEALRLYAGILYAAERRTARAAVCGAVRCSTPLLYLAGCRLVVLRTAGGVLLLPAVAAADAERFTAWAAGETGADGGAADKSAGPAAPDGADGRKAADGKTGPVPAAKKDGAP